MKNSNMSAEDSIYDYIVVGAGGAGMCLLLALHAKGLIDHKKILVLEPEHKTSNDRTWCFWAHERDAIVEHLHAIISNQWSYVDIIGQKKDISPFNYYYLRGLDFYTMVKEKVMTHPNVQWLQQSVRSIVHSKDDHQILTEEGYAFTGRFIFSSLYQQAHKDILGEENRILWQSFFGLSVKFETDCLQDDMVKLMDFSIDQDGYCQFIYLLPFTKNSALVEFTRFGKKMVTESCGQRILNTWITERYGNYEILGKEAGKIPMTSLFNPETPFHAPDDKIIPLGTAAGNVKCTTGYAFHTMFEHAFRIADALEQSHPVPRPYQQPRFAFYDNLLLILLHEKPYLGKLIFESLFNKVKTATILKFLNEKTSIAVELSILKSLPIQPFIWALFNKRKFNKKYDGKI